MKKTLTIILICIFLVSCSLDEPEKPKIKSYDKNNIKNENIVFISDFFQGDEYKLNKELEFNRETVYKENFEYKILSALRMLGYSFSKDKSDIRPAYVIILEQFKKENNIPVDNNPDTEIIDINTMKLIDLKLKNLEDTVFISSSRFSLNDNVISDNLNGVSPEFISSIIVVSLEALPQEYIDLNRENMLNCFVRQCGAGVSGGFRSFIIEKNTNNEIFVPPNHNNFDFYNWRLLGDFGNEKINPDRIVPVYMEVSIIIHEYVHYLDSAVYPQKQGTKQGIIDTLEFYKISFDKIDNEVFPIYGRRNQVTLKDNMDENDFIDNYAMSKARDGFVEDFAESFAAYVVSGNDFRQKASSNEVLKMKYDWLKNNVFNGIEYDTDLPRVNSKPEYVFDWEIKKLGH